MRRQGPLRYLWNEFQDSYDILAVVTGANPRAIALSVAALSLVVLAAAYAPGLAAATGFRWPWVSVGFILTAGALSMLAYLHRGRGFWGTFGMLIDNSFYVAALAWAAANTRPDFGLFFAAALCAMLLVFQGASYSPSTLLALAILAPTLAIIFWVRPDPMVSLALVTVSVAGFARTAMPGLWGWDPGARRLYGPSPFNLGDRYRLGALLGYGGMGSVYRGLSIAGRSVAIKLLHPHLFDRPEQRKALLKEALIVNQLDHPGVVKLLDSGQAEQGTPYLVMELLKGRTLRQTVEDAGGKLPWREVVRIAIDVLDILRAAHESQTVHCDVKPSNVFLCQNGDVKLLDFGIARSSKRLLEETMSVRIAGTPTCMAPEQVLDPASIDGRADLWALGATMFWAITSQWPRVLPEPLGSLADAAEIPPRRIDSLEPGIPASLAQAINVALELNPESRWSTAQVMRERLLEALEESARGARRSRSSAGRG